MFQVLGLVVVRISRFRDDGDLKWIGSGSLGDSGLCVRVTTV